MVAEGIIYQMMYMKRRQKSVRRRTTDWEEGKEKEKKTRDLSFPWIWQLVVSIGRFDGFALPRARGRDDRESRLACLDLDGPRPRPICRRLERDETRSTQNG